MKTGVEFRIRCYFKVDEDMHVDIVYTGKDAERLATRKLREMLDAEKKEHAYYRFFKREYKYTERELGYTIII